MCFLQKLKNSKKDHDTVCSKDLEYIYYLTLGAESINPFQFCLIILFTETSTCLLLNVLAFISDLILCFSIPFYSKSLVRTCGTTQQKWTFYLQQFIYW